MTPPPRRSTLFPYTTLFRSCIDRHQPHTGRGDEVLFDLPPLALTQQAVIDEHARELIAHGPVHECCGHSRIDAAGQTADEDRKSTRLNSSHVAISYAVFCLK